MIAEDVRRLLAIIAFSNKETAAALGMSDDSLVRKWKRGAEAPSGERASKLIELAAEALASQLIRALDVAADGRVEIVRLTVNPNTIALQDIERFSDMTQSALRAAFFARLMQSGLKIETGQ